MKDNHASALAMLLVWIAITVVLAILLTNPDTPPQKAQTSAAAVKESRPALGLREVCFNGVPASVKMESGQSPILLYSQLATGMTCVGLRNPS